MGIFGMGFDDTERFMLKRIQLQRSQAVFPNVCEKSADVVGIDIVHDEKWLLKRLREYLEKWIYSEAEPDNKFCLAIF